MGIFEVLAHPIRRDILCLLANGPLGAGEIAANFDVSKPAISKHLKRLHEGSLVTRTVDAQKRIYELDPTGLNAVDRWVADRRAAWATRLNKLEQYLEQAHGRRKKPSRSAGDRSNPRDD